MVNLKHSKWNFPQKKLLMVSINNIDSSNLSWFFYMELIKTLVFYDGIEGNLIFIGLKMRV